jgi:IS30 family transposase
VPPRRWRPLIARGEGDLILGTGNGSAVGTLVERSMRFTILLHPDLSSTPPPTRT